MKRTPVTDKGLCQYDHLPVAEAVLLAWAEEGNAPFHHRMMQAAVRDQMPLLARALDRLEAEPR